MANLRFRVLPRFPARLFADGGLVVVKDGADWTISPDWGLLSVLSSVTDPANTEVWVRVTSAGVSSYFRMTLQALLTSVASTGAGYAFVWNYSTDTTDADPGAGIIRFNQAVQNTATQFFTDLLDSAGNDLTALLDSLDDSTNTVKGNWSLVKVGDQTKRLAGTLTAVTSVAGYRKLVIAVTFSTSASPFANGEALLFTFARAGDSSAAPNPIVLPEGAAPSTPAANNIAIYAKADGLPYSKDDAGLETPLGNMAPTIQVFTASGTYTKPAGINAIVVEIVGAGGGGGGAGGSAAANGAASGGGGSGEYARRRIIASSVGATETVTCGAGGAGGIGNANGSAGGTTSFGTLLTAGGGNGGIGSSTGTNAAFEAGGAGGTGGTGSNFQCNGNPGSPGMRIDGTGGASIGGNGADSLFGGAGQGIRASSSTANGAAGSRGGGGSGSATHNNASANATGGAGGVGAVIVWEFY